MSYSIGVRAASKVAALAALASKFDETVVAHQPTHQSDRDQALATAAAMAGILPDDETKDVSISLNGWLSWTGSSDAPSCTAASVTASVSLVEKLPQTTESEQA